MTAAPLIPTAPGGVPPARVAGGPWVPQVTPPVGPVRGAGTERVVAVVGCHGGAGASTLARLLYPAADMGMVRDWSTYPAGIRDRWLLLLVARGTAAAATAATTTVAAAAAHDLHPAALVVVGDGPWPEPRPARVRYQLLAARVGVLRVPYVGRWRWVDDPLADTLPGGVARAVTAIETHLGRKTVGEHIGRREAPRAPRAGHRAHVRRR